MRDRGRVPRGRAGRARDCDVEEGVAAELGGMTLESAVWTGKSHERSHSSGARAYASEASFCPANQKGSRSIFSPSPKKPIEGSFEMGDFQKKKFRNQRSIEIATIQPFSLQD